jgi:hypothetical protein
MSLAKIVFYLQKNGVKDDVLYIVPDDDSDGYYVKLNQGQTGVVNSRYIKNHDLIRYIDLFFQSVVADEAGPDKIQIDCPTYPSVILDHSVLEDYLDVLEDQIDTLQEYWPEERVK